MFKPSSSYELLVETFNINKGMVIQTAYGGYIMNYLNVCINLLLSELSFRKDQLKVIDFLSYALPNSFQSSLKLKFGK